MVESEALEGRYVSPNQYESEFNVEAHYRTTGPEIWRQTGGDIDYFFAGFGTCGTITGVGRYLKERNPDIRIIGIEPAKRQHHLSGMKKISTLPEEFAPTILDRSILDDIVAVEDRDAYETGIRLAREDGIMVGPTTGALLWAALQAGVSGNGRAVVISPDGAGKYMSFYQKFLDGRMD
jgi:cysteine synthase